MKNTTKTLTVLIIGVFVIVIASAITSNENDNIGINTGINASDTAVQENKPVHNKGMIFKVGSDRVITTRAFKGNISTGETINYTLNTTGWEEVTVRFYSDDGVDVDIDDKKFKDINKKDHKVKGGKGKVDISIKGKNDGKHGIVVTGVEKKDGDGKPKHPDIKQKN